LWSQTWRQESLLEGDPSTLLPGGPSTQAVPYKRWGGVGGVDCLQGSMNVDHETLFRAVQGVIINSDFGFTMGAFHAGIPPDLI
jgi:hypothetical protein